VRTTGFLVFTHAATRAPCGDEASSGSAVGGVGGRTEKGGEEAAEGYFSDGTRSIRGGGKRQCWGSRASASVGSSSAPRRYPRYQRRGSRDPPHTPPAATTLAYASPSPPRSRGGCILALRTNQKKPGTAGEGKLKRGAIHPRRSRGTRRPISARRRGKRATYRNHAYGCRSTPDTRLHLRSVTPPSPPNSIQSAAFLLFPPPAFNPRPRGRGVG
jgi:hypothetical protein